MTLPCAMVIVSHDRALSSTRSVRSRWSSAGGASVSIRSRSAPTKRAREEDLARERELADRQDAFVQKTEDFIRKNIAGQKTKQAQSRRKMLDKLETVDRPEDVWQVAEKVAFRFAPAPRTGDIVLEATGLGATRGDRRLFDGVDLLVRRGERIAIVGPNGSGKSTLLKLLSGRGADEDEGDVRRGTNLAQGYFDQHLGSLDPERTAVEEIRTVRADLNVDGARQYLARFRIWGDDSLRKVSGFSGGERSRLALAKLLLEPRNLLFLDEPTNHLDIPAAEILEEALTGFEGTVVFVSHDRRFLEGVATRVIALRDGEVEIYPGGFADYRDASARAAAAAPRRRGREPQSRRALASKTARPIRGRGPSATVRRIRGPSSETSAPARTRAVKGARRRDRASPRRTATRKPMLRRRTIPSRDAAPSRPRRPPSARSSASAVASKSSRPRSSTARPSSRSAATSSKRIRAAIGPSSPTSPSRSKRSPSASRPRWPSGPRSRTSSRMPPPSHGEQEAS